MCMALYNTLKKRKKKKRKKAGDGDLYNGNIYIIMQPYPGSVIRFCRKWKSYPVHSHRVEGSSLVTNCKI